MGWDKKTDTGVYVDKDGNMNSETVKIKSDSDGNPTDMLHWPSDTDGKVHDHAFNVNKTDGSGGHRDRVDRG